MITVIDYRMGNLRSVAKALELSGKQVMVSSRPEDILRAGLLVLPGVGAYSKGMENLNELGIIPHISEKVKQGTPLLGICLGMQLMLQMSQEGDKKPGIGLLRGVVKRFGPGLRVPHVGWNTVSAKKSSPLFKGIPPDSYFYFVHSYYAVPENEEYVLAETDYGVSFASAICKENLFLTQFHPEKSQDIGLKMLKNFCNL